MNLFDKIFIVAVIVLYNVQTSKKQLKKFKEDEKYEKLLKYFNDHPSY